ncbi:hypothetical protein GF312_12690 [Candidatus Poribacteria bacterium]|nr:hypothetical protein [Candidatus Poribacteria bacterium]
MIYMTIPLALVIMVLNTDYENQNPFPHMDMVIGTSVSVPVSGERVTVDILEKYRKDNIPLRITGPKGDIVKLPLDNRGSAIWQTTRYGKYILEYNGYTRTIWVTSQPVIFNWWTGDIFPDFITHAMISGEDSEEYWRRRGVVRLHWIGGEYLSREEHQVTFRHPEQWFKNWWSRLYQISREPQQGVCLDELYATDERFDGVALPKAVTMLRNAAGEDFYIGVYYSGITPEFSTGMWYLRQSNVYHLEECYWGTEDIYLKRWQDVTLYRIQDQAVLVISPGFNQSKKIRGSLTPQKLREEFAMVRRVAPEAAGIGIFNAYKNPTLEKLADKLIQEYFLKPVIHLQPKNGNILARNIGHEDAEGCYAVFLNEEGQDLHEIKLKKLKSMESREIEIPSGAVSLKLVTPEDSVNIYPDGIYVFPKVMNPLQVIETSIKNMEVINSNDGDITFRAVFNKPLDTKYIARDSFLLQGVTSGYHEGRITCDNKSLKLSIEFYNLPSDFYTLRLISGRDKISDEDGLPLDGSDNGLLDPINDHYAVHFILIRNGKEPELPLPESSILSSP